MRMGVKIIPNNDANRRHKTKGELVMAKSTKATKSAPTKAAPKVVEKKEKVEKPSKPLLLFKRGEVLNPKQYEERRAFMLKFSTPTEGPKKGQAYAFRGSCKTKECTCSERQVAACFSQWDKLKSIGRKGEDIRNARHVLAAEGLYTLRVHKAKDPNAPVKVPKAPKAPKAAKEQPVKAVVESSKLVSAKAVAASVFASLKAPKAAQLVGATS